MNALRAIAAAFSYFSILPVRSFSAAPDGSVIGWLPLVGVLVGAASGLIGAAVFAATAAPLWALVAAFVASIVLTGAIHVDGFLDCADALFMTAAPRRRLDVLHDPRHGTYAVVAMALLAVVWIAALAGLVPARMPMALAFAAVTARAAVVPLAGQYPHARTGIRYGATRAYALVWFVAIAVAAWLLTHAWQPVALVAGAFLLAQMLAAGASRRLGGGLTGDVYGGIAVVTEVAVLTALPFAAAML